jgi:phage-related holin
MKNFIVNLFTSEPFILVKGALVILLGPLNHQLGYLLLAVAIDLVFGIQVAKKEKLFSWRVLFEKIRRKIFIYGGWIAMFHAFDMVAGLPDAARWAVILLLVGMELLSAAKNTAKLGYNKLADALEGVYISLVRTHANPNDPKNPAETQVARVEVDPVSDTLKVVEGSLPDESIQAENQPK